MTSTEPRTTTDSSPADSDRRRCAGERTADYGRMYRTLREVGDRSPAVTISCDWGDTL